MSSSTSEFEVFVASPSDVADERAIVAAAVEDVNIALRSKFGVRLVATGWEQVSPGAGRPQARINPLVDRCDVFIGIIGRTLGSATGEFESGLIEEYSRIRKRVENEQFEHVALFFLDSPDHRRSRTTKEIKRVLDFQAGVKSRREALYELFTDGSMLRAQLTKYLFEFALSRLPDSSTEVQGALNASASVSTELSTASEPLGSSQLQIVGLFKSFESLVRREHADEPVDAERLLLFALVMQLDESNLLPVRPSNALFQRRSNLILSGGERRLWLRTMASETGSAINGYTVGSVVPGWFVQRSNSAADWIEVSDDLLELMETGDFNMVAGAAQVLGEGGLRPSRLWDEAEVGDSESPWLKVLASNANLVPLCRYLIAVSRASDAPFIRARISSLPPETQTPIAAIAGWLDGDAAELDVLLSVAVNVIVHSWAPSLLEGQMSGLSTASLENVVTWAKEPRIEIEAIVELTRRAEGTSTILERLRKKDVDISQDALRALAKSGASLTPLLDEVVKIKDEEERDKTLAKIVAHSMSLDDVLDMVGSTLEESTSWGLRQWRMTAATRDPRLVGVARYVLDTDAAQFVGHFDPDQYKILVEAHGATARAEALAILGAAPSSLNIAGDRQYARAEVEKDSLWSIELSIRALLELGTKADAGFALDAINKNFRLRSDGQLLQRALEVSGGDLAQTMIKSENEDETEVAARHIAGLSHRLKDLEDLLYHEHARVRLIAVERAIAIAPDKDLEALLDSYPNGRYYYYNVMAALDRYLYAPHRKQYISIAP